ncbi:MAG: Protein of unknown function (DUF1553)/Protein of unknown function (DUF1549)/Planctomycete [Verrucomicrobiales bacterium]|nr:Protein of unknown function (DUF1553)/Protein of unknown function (DUF1549)/Planctomycete [Verrucomicrobiales bacterium]
MDAVVSLRRMQLALIIFGLGLLGRTTAIAVDHQKAAATHWSFQPLKTPLIPAEKAKSTLDRFVAHDLKVAHLSLSPEADRPTLIRRVAFVLTGLPPTIEEIDLFVSDRKAGAYERMVDRFLASPHYGERWAKIWLDAAGYADSNGYFNADTDRPLAWRYRDYVIRSFNRDKPFDQFVREQLAGDELSGWKPGQSATPEIIELLEATHFLRNGQDGSGESDGNPDEVRTDRYYALESEMQIIGSSLLGMTVQCAKCHDHKFEPITQKDYYAFQSFLYPAFNIEKWTKPQDRIVQANLPGELESWSSADKKLDDLQTELKRDFAAWVVMNRPAGKILFADKFDGTSLQGRWSNVAPGDNTPGGTPPVNLDSTQAPGAVIKNGQLQIVEGGGSGDRWISTTQSFHWKPAATGEWIQASFDLVKRKLEDKGKDAERVAYFIALHDFDHSSQVSGGNILLDGNPAGATSVQIEYPGPSAKSIGEFTAHYKPGQNFGVRVTRTGEDKFVLEHVVDGAVEGKAIELKGADLPDGGFGFEYCCGRSFIVDNVLIESSNSADPQWLKSNEAFQTNFATKRKSFEDASKAITAKRTPKPGRIAWMSDSDPIPPEVHLLKRGNHKTPGAIVEPAFPVFFKPDRETLKVEPGLTTSGRRLAWARWITETNSPQSGLLARVTVNRIWQNCFGTGLVSTPENLGLSGAKPAHPELLEWVASEFVRGDWKQKPLLKTILMSGTFRQRSLPTTEGMARDLSNRLLWRFPLQRLDAESIRDAMLAASGVLQSKTNGPYVPTTRTPEGEITVDESKPEAFARSIFLQHRRTQVPTFLANFDAPSIVFNCTRRAQTTMPLQSLSLLNSEFALKRAEDFAARLKRECGADDAKRIDRAFLLISGKHPEPADRNIAAQFLTDQRAAYADKPDADKYAWADFCQSLFAANHFLYLQ